MLVAIVVGVAVGVGLEFDTAVGVELGLGIAVGVSVSTGSMVAVELGSVVGIGVSVGVAGARVGLGVALGSSVAVGFWVLDGVLVCFPTVLVAVGLALRTSTTIRASWLRSWSSYTTTRSEY